ncbi:hypothetical protein [Halobacteriovorax sp. HLS]|uniref:hypothetical protein n=1 Tax=Halobacteriovorax sp. HLS TaxID=2234000 RepID=UPI000FD76CBB|nr:hypothetical protein [Halobacteriovorax sp. HLS]
MIEHLEKFIEKKSAELYPFAYALVPDDLQASQLIIDAVELLLVDSNLSPRLVSYYQNSQTLSSEQKLITDNLLSHIYRISKKRAIQLNGSYIIPKGFGAFYQTPMDRRAVVFLREKFSFSWERIAMIIGEDKVVAIQNYHLGIDSIHDFMGRPVEIISAK